MSEGKCWAVTSGSYSDYSVHAIFERQQDALAYAATQNGMSVKAQTRWQELDTKWLHRTKEEREEWSRLRVRMKADCAVEAFDFYPAGVVPVVAEP